MAAASVAQPVAFARGSLPVTEGGNNTPVQEVQRVHNRALGCFAEAVALADWLAIS